MSAWKYPRLFLGYLWGCLGYLGVFWSVQGCFGSVGGCIHALRGIWEHFLLNSHQFPWCTNKSTDIFQKTWRSQMSQISKCPRVTVILSYWEASGEVSKLRYKSLLYCASVGSYCSNIKDKGNTFLLIVRFVLVEPKQGGKGTRKGLKDWFAFFHGN